MSPVFPFSLRTAAGIIFSTAIGFLVLALFWQFCHTLPPKAPVFVSLVAFSLLVTTIYASVTTNAELNWNAVSIGCAAGVVAMGCWRLGQTGLLSPLPHTVLIPLMVTSVTVAASAKNLAGAYPQDARHFFETSRFVSAVHMLQGAFLFGVVLPSCIAWKWPRPFAAALICSAFALWQFWGGCPLTMAENTLRAREGKPIIPPEEGFIRDVFDRWGIPGWGKAVAAALHVIGICLCSWWGVEWLMSLFRQG